jgi:hypothetical protein
MAPRRSLRHLSGPLRAALLYPQVHGARSSRRPVRLMVIALPRCAAATAALLFASQVVPRRVRRRDGPSAGHQSG